MRHLLHTSLTILLITIVMGCSRSVDKRLVLADTLMWTNPDSSLAILTVINRDSLQGEDNLAYHALLLTQAQFRCNGSCAGDSLINIALNYYSNNHNREHYTRSLLYKGAYYEFNTNQPVEAMRYYKMAEDNADTTDYRNLAQLSLRMGKLYYDNYASNNLDLEKFEKALYYYERLGDRPMIMFCLGIAGNLCRESQKKKAIKYLTQAQIMAIEMRDTASSYSYLNELSMAYFLDSLFLDAKNASVKCVNGTNPSNAMLFNAANAYAALGMPDSAKILLARVDTVAMSDYDRMMMAFANGYIHNAQGHEKEALFYQNLGTRISDAIKAKSQRNLIFEKEAQMDSELKYKKDKHFSEQKTFFFLIIAVLIVFLITLITNLFCKDQKFKNLVKELNNNQFYVKELIKDTNIAYDKLNQEKQKNSLLQHNYKSQQDNVDFLNQYFNSFNALLNKSYDVKRADFIKELENIIAQASANDHYWDIIFDVADKKSAGFISSLTKDSNCQLNQNEIRILSLVCLGYNNDAISISTGYTKNSIKTIKTRIRNKIKASENLEAFIKQEILNRNRAK